MINRLIFLHLTQLLRGVFFVSVVFNSVSLVMSQNTIEDCPQISASTAIEFSNLIKAENYEQMPLLLTGWEHSCGELEVVFRARALFLIQNNQFQALNQQNILDQATAFEIRHNLYQKERLADSDDYFYTYPEYFGYVPIGGDFDQQTMQWARRLQRQVPQGSLAFLFLQLYAGEPEVFFATLQEGHFGETNLSEQYHEKVRVNLRRNEFNLGVSTSAWIPSGDIAIIGARPAIGVLVGAKTRNTYWDALFEFRFGNTSNDFYFTVKDTLISTRNYQGAYVGAEITRILKRFHSSALEFFAGVGYDVIDIVEDSMEPERQTFRSPALHGGLGYRFHFSNRTWLSCKPGFYWLDHQHARGSSLQGNAFMIKLAFGYTENAAKSTNLKRLGIKNWW